VVAGRWLDASWFPNITSGFFGSLPFPMRQLVPAIEKKLGDGPYLLGEKLTVFDFGIASRLAGTLDNQPGTWATALVKEFQPVVDYAERVQAAVGVYCREVV
jgi:hypothetical protein